MLTIIVWIAIGFALSFTVFALAFGDSWSWPSALAATLVLAGVVLAQMQPRA